MKFVHEIHPGAKTVTGGTDGELKASVLITSHDVWGNPPDNIHIEGTPHAMLAAFDHASTQLRALIVSRGGTDPHRFVKPEELIARFAEWLKQTGATKAVGVPWLLGRFEELVRGEIKLPMVEPEETPP